MNDSERLLRNSLRANGAFSALSGLAFTFAGGTLAASIGLAEPRLLLAVGLGLLGFSGYLVWLASRPSVDLASAMQVVYADLAWVLGTIPIVAFGVLNGTGNVAAVALADVVLLFAVLQYLGIRRVRGAAATAAPSGA